MVGAAEGLARQADGAAETSSGGGRRRRRAAGADRPGRLQGACRDARRPTSALSLDGVKAEAAGGRVGGAAG